MTQPPTGGPTPPSNGSPAGDDPARPAPEPRQAVDPAADEPARQVADEPPASTSPGTWPGMPTPPQAHPGQPQPGPSYPGQPQLGQGWPGQPGPAQLHQPITGHGHPGHGYPAQPAPGQGFPGQPMASPVSGQPNYGHPFPGQPTSAQPVSGYPGTVEFGKHGFAAPQGYPPYDAQQPPAKRKRGLLIASIVLAVVLVFCGGGGLAAFLLLRGDSGEGAAEPVAAADGFLRAVYVDHDPDKAAALVCPSARDTKKINKKVDEIKGYAKTYKNPRFRWETPKVDDQNAERAIVSVKLRMITGDEKFSDQQLKLTVVQKNGWWVCEVG